MTRLSPLPGTALEGYEWWQWGIIYQVYPRSFQDSNGDGIGDLAGITSRLDYLQWLGFSAVWISPFYPSPMADFGYDVSDHTDVHPMFGDLRQFDELVAEAHRRGLRIILDYVPNHTSEQHPWFLESRSSRHNPKRDWYIWRDAGPDGSPPNNWLSHFGGAAWQWDEGTGQYYLHSFLKEQPDLNWRNPEVVEAMLDVLRFWMDRGVDGFRVDVMWETIKDAQLRDNPPNPGYVEGRGPPYLKLLPLYNADQPEIHDIVRRLREVLDEYGDKVLIGEIYLPVERLVTYYGRQDGEGCHLPYNFQLLLLPWDARRIASAVDTYEAHLPEFGWPNWVLGNHDRPRPAHRLGEKQARVAALLLLTLRGTPTIYYGDELGMPNVRIPPEAVQDPVETNLPGTGLGRDPERTPMQWDSTRNAGFTAGAPWLPLSDDRQTRNVAVQRRDPRSMLTLHKRLIELRQSEPALMVGSYQPLPAEGHLIAYLREAGDRRFLVALNLYNTPATFALPEHLPSGHIILSTHLDRENDAVRGAIDLRPDEAVIVELNT